MSSTTSLTVQRKYSIVNLAFSCKYDTLCTVIPTFIHTKGTTMDDQTYQIALSPDLRITLEEFANAWNEDDIARTFAEAHLSQAKGTHFFHPMLITVLLTVGSGIAIDLLSDLIKGVIQRLIDKNNAQSGLAT